MKKIQIKITCVQGKLELSKVLNELIDETIKKAMTEIYLKEYNDRK